MSTNVDEEIAAHVDTESDALQADGHSDTSDTRNDQSGFSLRQKLLVLGKLLLHLGCLGYSLYLIWLLAYLKENNNYWYFSFIPFVFNFAGPCMACRGSNLINEDPHLRTILLHAPSIGVVLNLMACFTMLTREVYYHRQSDEFIGPRFIIISLQGSIILIILDFFFQREGKLDNLLNCKDALTRMLLDFVDIFNMVEILSKNDCVGVGSFVSEESSTEKAIQAFCTISFMIVLLTMDITALQPVPQSNEDDREQQLWSRTHGEEIYYGVTAVSGFYQNLPFLVIRIVVWAQYKLYSLGFLVKNVTAVVLSIAICFKN